jgi:hypothetical protein
MCTYEQSYLPNGVKQDKQQHNQEPDRAVHRTLKNNSQRFSRTPVFRPQAAVGLKANSVSPVWPSDGKSQGNLCTALPRPGKMGGQQKATASGGFSGR